VPKACQVKTSSARRQQDREEDKPPKAKINYALLRRCEDKATKVRDEVDNRIPDMDHDADIHAQYQEMVTIVRETCKELLTESEIDAVSSNWFESKKEHLSSLLRVEQTRRKAYIKLPDYPADKKQESYELYRQALNQSKSEIRIARGEFWDDVTKKLEDAFNMNDQGRFNKLVASTFSSTRKKDIQHGTQCLEGMVYNKQKTVLTATKQELEDRWYEHFHDIFSTDTTLESYYRPGADPDGGREVGNNLTLEDFLPPQQATSGSPSGLSVFQRRRGYRLSEVQN
jgi:hypothetical protein